MQRSNFALRNANESLINTRTLLEGQVQAANARIATLLAIASPEIVTSCPINGIVSMVKLDAASDSLTSPLGKAAAVAAGCGMMSSVAEIDYLVGRSESAELMVD